MTNRVNVAVIGVGRIGQIHAHNLKTMIPKANLLAVSDVVDTAVHRVGKELDVPVVATDYREFLDRPDIDGVVICSSTDTHAPIIKEAAAAGKHIFCEKPIALDVAEIKQALAEVEKAGVKLQVGFNRRFDPGFKKARDLIANGTIGTPQLVRISSRDPAPPPLDYVKISGGMFLDMTIHDFDMARFLLGEEVEEIIAVGGCLIDPEIGDAGDIDTGIVVLKYASGAMGSIDNSRQAVYGYDQRLEVLGSKGNIVVGNKTPTEVMVYSQNAICGDVLIDFFMDRYQESYLAEMFEFVNCIAEDREPSVGGIDGLVSVQMAYAALKSLQTGCPVSVE